MEAALQCAQLQGSWLNRPGGCQDLSILAVKADGAGTEAASVCACGESLVVRGRISVDHPASPGGTDGPMAASVLQMVCSVDH